MSQTVYFDFCDNENNKNKTIGYWYQILKTRFSSATKNFIVLSCSTNTPIKKWEISKDCSSIDCYEFGQCSEKNGYLCMALESGHVASKKLAWGKSNDKLQVFDFQTNQIIYEKNTNGSVRCLLWHKVKNELVLIAGLDHPCNEILVIPCVFGGKNEPVVTVLKEHTNSVSTLAIYENNKLVSCSYDGTICIWCLLEHKLLRKFQDSSQTLRTMCKIGDTGIFATGSYDGCIKFWDLNKGSEIVIMENVHGYLGSSFLYSPTLKMMVSSDLSGVVKIWSLDFSSGFSVSLCFHVPSPFYADGCGGITFLDPLKTQVLVGGENNSVFVIDLISKRITQTFSSKLRFDVIRGFVLL